MNARLLAGLELNVPDTTRSSPTPSITRDGQGDGPGSGSPIVGDIAASTAPGGFEPASETNREAKGSDVMEPAGPTGGTGLWWLSVGVGAVILVPLSWLLSNAALLPFLLGVFFYVLFGLVVGAIMHRVAASGRPYPRGAVLVGTTIVVLVGSSASIVFESRDVPRKMANQAAETTFYIGDQTAEAFRSSVQADMLRVLREDYEPGGVIGYVRWVLTSGEFAADQITGISRTQRATQSGILWGVRVVASIALLGLGIGSQTFLLRLTADPAVIAPPDPDPPIDDESPKES